MYKKLLIIFAIFLTNFLLSIKVNAQNFTPGYLNISSSKIKEMLEKVPKSYDGYEYLDEYLQNPPSGTLTNKIDGGITIIASQTTGKVYLFRLSKKNLISVPISAYHLPNTYNNSNIGSNYNKNYWYFNLMNSIEWQWDYDTEEWILTYEGNKDINTYWAWSKEPKILYTNHLIRVYAQTEEESYYIQPTVLESELEYKTGFISSDGYDILGKISLEFNQNDTNLQNFKKAKIKLQYGANDFTKKNIPVFSHYKIYGKREEEDSYSLLKYDDLKYDSNSEFDISYDVNPKIIDTTFDYTEGLVDGNMQGVIAESSITFEINWPSNLDLIYDNFKIEFYFENNDNGFIYVYDTFNNSNWNDTEKFLENYAYYHFPSNYKYAYISNKSNELKNGRIYIPFNSTINEKVKLQAQYLDIEKNLFTNPVYFTRDEKETYYSYYDFDINNKKIFVLNRKTNENNDNSYYSIKVIENIINNIKNKDSIYKNDIINLYDEISDYESTYFYIPSEFYVKFSDGKGNVQIATPDGYIDITSEDLENNYEVNNDNNSINNIFDSFKNFSNINYGIFKHFSDVYNSLRNSKIGNYIFILIVGSILVLIIKSLKR